MEQYLAKPVRITEHAWENNPAPLVSISCITYNHENFIRVAIEGFLMQETTFPVEILIHDDASTDRTAEIIQEYQQKYPHLIFPIYQTENQHSKGVKISATYQFPRARGKYIALCEGDDYWLDCLKLQKQVEFLEQNQNYTACFTNAVFADEFKNVFATYVTFLEEGEVNPEDIIRLGGYIYPTCTLVFRKQVSEDLRSNIVKSLSGDTKLIVFAAIQGKVFFLNEKTAVYRRWYGGLYSRHTSSPERVSDWKKKEIAGYRELIKVVNSNWKRLIRQKISSESLYIIRNSKSIKRFIFLPNLTKSDVKVLLRDFYSIVKDKIIPIT